MEKELFKMMYIRRKLDTVYNKRQPRQKKEKMNYRELD